MVKKKDNILFIDEKTDGQTFDETEMPLSPDVSLQDTLMGENISSEDIPSKNHTSSEDTLAGDYLSLEDTQTENCLTLTAELPVMDPPPVAISEPLQELLLSEEPSVKQSLLSNDNPLNISPAIDAISEFNINSKNAPTDASAVSIHDIPEEPSKETSETPPNDTTASDKTSPIVKRQPSENILAIDSEAKVQSTEEMENQLWMELRNAQRSRRILSSTLSGIERLENGLPLAIVYYKDMRIAIPATEMALPLSPQDFQTDAEIYNRYAQLLSRMLAAEIDFTIAGLDRRGGVILGSRKQAMQRKQQRYYHSDGQGKTLISVGQLAEARVISVSEKMLRVEVFGVEANVTARDMAWEWVDDAHAFYQVGDRVPVRVNAIHQDPESDHLSINVSIRDAIADPTAGNLQKCSINGKYIGTVTGIENVVYVRLNIGVNAIATTVRDPRVVCRKDEVSFVITRIDYDANLAIGIITRIIKQAN